jgi:hypothetical protein
LFSCIQGGFSGGVALPSTKKGASKTTRLDQDFSFATSKANVGMGKFCQQNIGAVLLESQNQHLFASLVHHRILGRSIVSMGSLATELRLGEN